MNEHTQFSQRTYELLNADIDGELNESEQDELNQLLAASSDVRAWHESLKSLTQTLDTLAEQQPPEYLQSSIEKQVRLPEVSGRNNAASSGSFSHWFSAQWMRPGLAIAAGVLLTITIYQGGSGIPDGTDSTTMSGTIAPNNNFKKALLGSVEVKSGELTGTVKILATGDASLIMEVDLQSVLASSLEINFAHSGLAYEGPRHVQSTMGEVTFKDGAIRISGQGVQHLRLQLRRTDTAREVQAPSLDLGFYSGESLVQSSQLTLKKPQ